MERKNVIIIVVLLIVLVLGGIGVTIYITKEKNKKDAKEVIDKAINIQEQILNKVNEHQTDTKDIITDKQEEIITKVEEQLNNTFKVEDNIYNVKVEDDIKEEATKIQEKFYEQQAQVESQMSDSQKQMLEEAKKKQQQLLQMMQ